MKRITELHQYLSDGHPHNLDAIQRVDLTPDDALRYELCQSDPAVISLLVDTFGRLADPHRRTPPCQLFGEDEILGTIEPLPGVRLCSMGLTRIEANDPSISAEDRRHYVSHDLLPQVVLKLAAALGDPVTTEEAQSMLPGTLDALQRLSPIITKLANSIQH